MIDITYPQAMNVLGRLQRIHDLNHKHTMSAVGIRDGKMWFDIWLVKDTKYMVSLPVNPWCNPYHLSQRFKEMVDIGKGIKTEAQEHAALLEKLLMDTRSSLTAEQIRAVQGSVDYLKEIKS